MQKYRDKCIRGIPLYESMYENAKISKQMLQQDLINEQNIYVAVKIKDRGAERLHI